MFMFQILKCHTIFWNLVYTGGSQELTIDRLIEKRQSFRKLKYWLYNVHVRCIQWGNCGMRFISVSLESCPPSYFFISLPFIVVCPTLGGSAGPTKKRCSATYFATIFKNLILLSPFFPTSSFHFSHQIFSFFPTSSFHFSHQFFSFENPHLYYFFSCLISFWKVFVSSKWSKTVIDPQFL